MRGPQTTRIRSKNRRQPRALPEAIENFSREKEIQQSVCEKEIQHRPVEIGSEFKRDLKERDRETERALTKRDRERERERDRETEQDD